MVMGDGYSVFDDPFLTGEEEEEELPKPEDLVVATPEPDADYKAEQEAGALKISPSSEPQIAIETEDKEYSVFDDSSLHVAPDPVEVQEDRLEKVTEPLEFPVFGEVIPELRVRKDSPDVQFAAPMVYSADENPTVQQGLVLFTPYAGVNAMYEEFSSRHASSDINSKDREVDENNLAENIVATVFVDATSELAGNRQYDKLAEQIGAPEGTRDYRSFIDSNLLTPPGGKPLTDREDYAEFAINSVIKNTVFITIIRLFDRKNVCSCCGTSYIKRNNNIFCFTCSVS